MLSASTKKRLRHVALVGVVVSFVLLYVGPVTLASVPMTAVALAVTAAVAVVAALAF